MRLLSILRNLPVLFFMVAYAFAQTQVSDVVFDQDQDTDFFGSMVDDFDYSSVSFFPIPAKERDFVFDPDLANSIAAFLEKTTEPFWNNTKAPVGRDVLYLLPAPRVVALPYGGVAANFFFNMTDRMRVTVGSLFNLDSQKDAIQGLIKALVPDDTDPVERHELLPLLKKITIQERKMGLLLQTGLIYKIFSFQLHSSLQMGVRNFWLSKRDRAELNTLFPNQDSIDERELYKIRVGIGDTRLRLGMNTINLSSFQMDLGLETILPTSRFSHAPLLPNSFTPSFSLDSIVKTLRLLRDYYIEPRLGNDGHFAIGTFMETKIGLFHELAQLRMRVSFDKFFPCDEDRPILFRQTFKDGQDFLHQVLEAIQDGDTQEISALVNRFLGEFIFPPVFRINVRAGSVFNAVAAVTIFPAKNWSYTFGYDLYLEQHERITRVYNSDTSLDDLRIEDVQALAAIQHKFFSETLYTHDHPQYSASFGWGWDMTLLSQKIGKDWTFFLKGAISF